MAQKRRKCRLADSAHKDVDLRQYGQIIKQTIEQTVPGKNPKVFKEYFSTDPLTQAESVSLGRALSKLTELKEYGKTVTTFRLFDGKTYDSEEVKTPSKTSVPQKAKSNKNTTKGGRIK